MGSSAGPSGLGRLRRFRRFVSLSFLSFLLILLVLVAADYKSNSFGLRTPANAVVYDFLPATFLFIYFLYLIARFVGNAYEWNNKILGEITSDEAKTAATSLMISFRRYAKSKRDYQTGILVAILAFYCAYLSITHGTTTQMGAVPIEICLGVLILGLSYIVGRYFKPAEVFMSKFIRMFYQMPSTEPMSEGAINHQTQQKLDEIKAEHPSWFN